MILPRVSRFDEGVESHIKTIPDLTFGNHFTTIYWVWSEITADRGVLYR